MEGSVWLGERRVWLRGASGESWMGMFGLVLEGSGWLGERPVWLRGASCRGNGQVFKISLLSVTNRTPGLGGTGGDIRQTQRPFKPRIPSVSGQ